MASDELNVPGLIEVLISEIEIRGAGNFSDHVSFLKRGSFKIKDESQPLSEFSMVLDKGSYYLCHNFAQMQLINQCAMLVHESVHDRQIRNMGRAKFFAKYATFSGRMEIELEAFKEEFRFYWVIGWLVDPRKLYGFADFMVSQFKKNYFTLFFFTKKKQERFRQALLSVVYETDVA